MMTRICKILLMALALLLTTPVLANPKYHTIQVALTGIDDDLANQIKQDLMIYHATTEKKVTSTRIEILHNKAQPQILAALQALGYYHAQVTSNLKQTTTSTWQASYQINLGQATVLRDIDISVSEGGELDQNLLTKITNSSLVTGQQLNHHEYEKAKKTILTNLFEHGFLDAKFITSKIAVNREEYYANIMIVVAPGKQYHFGQINFIADKYPAEFLQRYLPFKPGDPYLAASINQLKNNLLGSNLFSKVRIDPTPDLSDPNNYTVPIKVRTTAKPKNKYSGSVGYGTDTNLRGGVSWLHRREKAPGHQIHFGVNGSKVRKEAFANYLLPGKNPVVDSYSIGANVQEETVKEKYNRSNEISASKIKKYRTRQQLWTISYLSETFRDLPTKDKHRTSLIIPSAKLTWLKPVLTANREHGTRHEFITKGALKSLLSDTDFLQFELNNKLVYPLNDDFRAIFKANVGTTAIAQFDKLPLSLRYFAGGDYSVRGFAYKSLGPTETDSAGNTEVIGGKHSLLFSSELEKTIYDKLHAAIFIDAGNAMNKFRAPLAVGAGAGIGYATPVGSLKIYIAKPLNKINNKKVRIHITFGTDL